MTPTASIYLDAVRFAAALLVFVTHFSMQRVSGGFLWQITPWGHEAVAVFFVLSGYVIAHTTATREKTAGDYALSRCARMVSVALPAVVLTAVLDTWGQRLNPQVYSPAWGFVPDLTFTRFFTALTFTHELWGLNIPQGSNAAYWSLGYEVPYYVLFGLALFMPRPWRWPSLALGLIACGPAIAAALPVWLAGVLVYRLGQQRLVPVGVGRVLFFAPIPLWALYQAAAFVHGRPQWPANQVMDHPELPQLYVAGGLFAMQLAGLVGMPDGWSRWLLHRQAAIRWLAGASFSLYLFHLPLALFLLAAQPWPISDPRARCTVFFGTLLGVFVLAELTERRKAAWRKALGRMAARLISGSWA